MSALASDEILKLGRLEGQVMGIPESVRRMQEELERLRARVVELTRGPSTIKEGLVNFSDFLELRGLVGRHEAEITSLRARFEMSPTLPREPAEGSRAPVPVYFGNRNTLSIFLKLFQTWTLTCEAKNALVTDDSIRVVGRERAEPDSTHEGGKCQPVHCYMDRSG